MSIEHLRAAVDAVEQQLAAAQADDTADDALIADLQEHLTTLQQELDAARADDDADDAEIAALKARVADLESQLPPPEPEPEPDPATVGHALLDGVKMVSGASYPIGGKSVGIEAIPDVAGIASVRFRLGAHTQVESNRPWALWGDTSGGLSKQALAEGQHTLTIEWYSETAASGSLVGTTEIPFTATPAPVTEPEPEGPTEPPVGEVYTVASVSDLVAKAKLPGAKTIRAAAGAAFGGVNLDASVADVVIEGLRFTTGIVRVYASKNVTLKDCQFIGSGTHYNTRNAIMSGSGTDGLVVDGCTFEDVGRAFSGTGKRLRFLRNRGKGFGHDFFQIGGGSEDVEVAYNFATGWRSVTGAHRDFVQFGTWNGNPIRRVHIHHNVGFKGSGQSFQFLLIGNEDHLNCTDLLIEHNLGYSQHAIGITVMSDWRGALVRRNTVLGVDPAGNKVLIDAKDDSGVYQDNIANGLDGTGLVVPGQHAHAEVFEDFQHGRFTVENFRVKAGLNVGCDIDQLKPHFTDL